MQGSLMFYTGDKIWESLTKIYKGKIIGWVMSVIAVGPWEKFMEIGILNL